MASTEDLVDGEPPVIKPYEVLGVDRSATADQVKSAYRKAALKHHPDKVAEKDKSEAHGKFQEIAFAYAILSDPSRRMRYDETGSTAETIASEEGFVWAEFFRAQFENAVNEDAILKFADKYQGSLEEKNDVLAAYEKFKGKMDAVYANVMLIDVLKDDDRIRKIIDDAITAGAVNSYPKYVNETEKSKQVRIKAAKKEAAEAEKYAKELGVHDKLFGDGMKKSKKDSEADLATLIQKNAQNRGSIIDQLEQKYGGKAKGKSAKKRSADEADDGGIPDDEFAAVQARIFGGKGSKAKKQRASKTRD